MPLIEQLFHILVNDLVAVEPVVFLGDTHEQSSMLVRIGIGGTNEPSRARPDDLVGVKDDAYPVSGHQDD